LTLVWVPTQPIADVLAGIEGVATEVVVPGPGPLPASAAEAAVYVPPMVPDQAAVAVMARLPRLRLVQTITAGVDVLIPGLPSGVTLCNARGVHDTSTAEWTVAAMLASIRQFPYFAGQQAAGQWQHRVTGSLAGKNVLIVGYGSIGQALERRLAGFEVTVTRVARRAREGVHAIAELPGLLPAADVVVLLAPQTAETVGMVDAAFLNRMKDGALLVNSARGILVRTDDLTEALRTGRIYAAVDVTDPEPLPEGHPLWALPNVFITPHVAASTPASFTAAFDLVRAQVQRFCSGAELANVITGDY
jgi:phosphoglycerate dehydrogenase-like enzyme